MFQSPASVLSCIDAPASTHSWTWNAGCFFASWLMMKLSCCSLTRMKKRKRERRRTRKSYASYSTYTSATPSFLHIHPVLFYPSVHPWQNASLYLCPYARCRSLRRELLLRACLRLTLESRSRLRGLYDILNYYFNFWNTWTTTPKVHFTYI